MAQDTEIDEATDKKSSKMPLVAGLVLAIVGGGGGFYAVQSGLILGDSSQQAQASGSKDPVQVSALPDVTFIPVDPLIIPVSKANGNLHFRAQLEVGSAYKSEVEHLMPRVVDVLNNYLRALEPEDLMIEGSLARLRGQMLRRVQIVTGGDRIKDLLIMEFVIN